MTDKVIDKAWSNIQVDDFVRWVTPRFIKYGWVKRVAGNSMRVRFMEDAKGKETAIPEAKWYFVQGKANPDAEEHLVVIDYKQWWNGDHTTWEPIEEDHPLRAATMSVEAACEMLAWDAKKVRRFIRRGHIEAVKKEDRWLVYREALKEKATRSGWI